MRISSENRSRLHELGLALVALVLIAGALTLTFSHVLQSGPNEIAGRYDIFRYYAPITFYLDFCLSQGELPLWNPLVYCGLPNAANPQAFVFYPLNLLRSFLLPAISPQSTNESLVVLMGLHLLFMGLCTYILGRVHRLSFPAALLAGLAWVCSALIVRRACEYHFLYTMAWLPLILLLVKAAIDTRHSRLKLVFSLLAGLFFGVAILGGFLQIVNYVGVCIGVYALIYRLTTSSVDSQAGWRRTLGRLGVEGTCFALLVAIAGLTAMVLLLPTVELAPFSTRDKGTQVKMYSDVMAWDLNRLYQSIVIYAGPKWETETLRTAGITALLLAAAGCFHRRKKLVALFGLLAYALIDCGFGPPFPIASLVNLLTPFSSSAYSRGFDFALLPLGLLAGLGVDTLRASQGHPGRRKLIALVLIYIAAATVIPLWSWTQPHGYLPVNLSVVLAPLASLIAMLLLLTLRRWRYLAYATACALPALLVAETYAWNSVFVPWMVKRHLNETPPPQGGHAFPTANQRWTDPIPNRTLYHMDPAMNGVDPLHLAGMRELVSGQFRERLNKREVREWEPTAENTRGNLFLKRFFWLVPTYSTAPLPGKQSLFPPTQVAYLDEAPGSALPEFSTASRRYESVSDGAVRSEVSGAEALRGSRARNQNHRLWFTVPRELNGTAAGPAGVLHSTLVYHYTGSIDAQIDTVFTDEETGRTQWGLRHRVKPSQQGTGVIEVPVPDMHRVSAALTIKGERAGSIQITDAYLLTDVADQDGALTLRSFSANRAELSVTGLNDPTLLVFLDAWYPGWRASVDGQATPILRANGEFKAIEVPPGTHEVVFEYRPRSVFAGMAVSGGTVVITLVLIGGLTRSHWRMRRPPPPSLHAPMHREPRDVLPEVEAQAPRESLEKEHFESPPPMAPPVSPTTKSQDAPIGVSSGEHAAEPIEPGPPENPEQRKEPS